MAVDVRPRRHLAVRVAYLFGAKEIYLLGFDMKATSGKTHCHGDHPKPLSTRGNYKRWVERLGLLARELERVKVDVLNCTRVTALRCFRFANLEDVTNGLATQS